MRDREKEREKGSHIHMPKTSIGNEGERLRTLYLFPTHVLAQFSSLVFISIHTSIQVRYKLTPPHPYPRNSFIYTYITYIYNIHIPTDIHTYIRIQALHLLIFYEGEINFSGSLIRACLFSGGGEVPSIFQDDPMYLESCTLYMEDKWNKCLDINVIIPNEIFSTYNTTT